MRFEALLGVLLVGCASGPPSVVPGELTDVPWRGGPGDAVAIEARQVADRGDPRRALAMLEEVLAESPRHIDAQRVRQDLLQDRGRIGLVRSEAEQRLVAWGDAASAHYLAGRIARDDATKRVAFESALARDPNSFWGWLGLAFVERNQDPAHALAIYDGLYRATRGHPLVGVAYGALARVAGEDRIALEVYGALRGRPEVPGVGDLGLAETHLFADRRREGWSPLLESLRQRPWDSGLQRILETLVGQGLPGAQIEQILGILWEDPARGQTFVDAGGGPLLAALLERAGSLPSAFEALRAHLDDAGPAVRRHERRLAFATGDVAGFLARLGAQHPPALFAQEDNQVRGLWLAITEGPWTGDADPLADPVHSLDLTRALVDAGLLVEAEIVAGLGLARHGDVRDVADALRELRDEVRREIAFEGALRRMIYQGYGADPRPLGEFLDALRRVSREILGTDVVGEPTTFAVPLVGQLVDPFGSGLAAHLRRYNRHLVLGQRSAGPIEGLLMTRVSVRYLDQHGPLPLAGRCWEIVAEDREIESLQGLLGGDLAGIALLNHYVIDLDAVRDWGASIRDRRAIVRADGDALLGDPLPTTKDPLDPVDAGWRLVALSPVQDTDVDMAVLDMIRWHERAHLVDSFRYLPPESNLWRVLGLMIEHAFSSTSIEAEMEGRAETAALAFSAHPELVLAHVAGFLEGAGAQSPHGTGFARLAGRVNARLAADPEFASRAAVSHWHELPVARIRQIAQELADELWP